MTASPRITLMTAVIAVAVLAGCQAVDPGPSTAGSSVPSSFDAASLEPTLKPTPEPTASVAAGCVNPPDILDLIAPERSQAVDPVTCYGDAPLTFDAQWVNPGIADCPTAPEPAWLACSGYTLRAVGETGKVGVPELFVAIHPSLTTLPDAGSNIRVTGHFDDPAAQDCHDTFALPDASPEPVEVIVARCQRQLVITALEELQP